MPKKDIDIIADELWWICKEYNGIPSQTVDKKAYSKALYILKTYGETPQIKAVFAQNKFKNSIRFFYRNRRSKKDFGRKRQNAILSNREIIILPS